MKSLRYNVSSIGLSVILNVGVLLALLFIQRAVAQQSLELVLESIFTEEPPQEEITRDLQLDTAPAETLNVIAGGTPSTSVGASAQPAAAPVNVQKAAVMKEVNIRPVLADAALPSDAMIGEELGEGEIVGDVGAAVEGYGAAMGIITQEIIRMMRESKVTVIWLFDESGSLEDDRKEIRENYHRVYEELGLAAKQDKDLRKGSELLLTVVASYGKDLHEHLPQPSADVEKIKAAIDRIPTDTTGQENMSQSIAKIIQKYKRTAINGKRKIAVIVVSDESGDDGAYVEQAVAEARAAKSPIYFLGRESTFGFPYAHQRWVDDETKEEFWIRIRRGPETPYPECLQWNGLHSRWDVTNSGFGPYEQVRLARETGGIFFVLPGEEATLVGADSNDRRKYDFLSMREYQPDLESRPAYMQERSNSEFRNTLWQVIVRLNPNGDELLFGEKVEVDPGLTLQNEHFPLLPEPFRQAALGQAEKAVRSMLLTQEAIGLLERIKPLRAKEASPRWRAGYDLALAQLYMFRLRLYQYLLALDQHANAMPKPTNPKSNEWNFWWGGQPIVPDEAQFERMKVAFGLKQTREEYNEFVKTEEAAAIERLKAVITDHPGTPWARRAQGEIDGGFGFRSGERAWDVSGRRAEAAKRVPNL
ncbi:MAG: VWA domain-containing protein [Planctomycetaceae bacterium]|nr:VWA domain-containing protein [Planctomycetaceae bacterium]